MTAGGWLGFAIQVGLLVCGLAALTAVLLLLRAISDVLPISGVRRHWLLRVRAPAGLLVWGFGALVGLLYVSERVSAVGLAGLTALLLLAVLLGWQPLRDVAVGSLLKGGGAVSVYDTVRIGQLEGRIVRLGLRTLHLMSSTGDRVEVPFSATVGQPLVRLTTTQAATPHVFRAAIPRDRPAASCRQTVLEACLLHHWSSPTQPPQIREVGDAQFEITLFVVASEHASEVEAAVRGALDAEPV